MRHESRFANMLLSINMYRDESVSPRKSSIHHRRAFAHPSPGLIQFDS
jgi:hypothetical protein